jgi:hypothetical protein
VDGFREADCSRDPPFAGHSGTTHASTLSRGCDRIADSRAQLRALCGHGAVSYVSLVGDPDDDYVAPWWGEVDPDILILVANPEALINEFVLSLREHLQVLMNEGTLLVAAADLQSDDELPSSVYGVVTDDKEVAEWTRSWGGNLVTFERADGGLQLTGRTVGRFSTAEDAVVFAANEVTALPDDPQAQGISVIEHRRLEVVLTAAISESETVTLDAEDRALLNAAIETLRAQMASPVPDRHIIGRVLRRFAQIGGALAAGVAGNYLTDLIHHFHVPWP